MRSRRALILRWRFALCLEEDGGPLKQFKENRWIRFFTVPTALGVDEYQRRGTRRR